MNAHNQPNKDFMTTVLLSLLLGGFGADRFYLGKIGTGLLKLISFGGFGIWYFIDIILILSGSTKDKAGNPLSGRDKRVIPASIVSAIFLFLFSAFMVYAVITAPPTIELNSLKPNETATIEDSKYTFQGKTFPSSSIVTINGKEVPTGTDGTFIYEAEVNEGNNTFELKTVDGDKVTTQLYTIKRLTKLEIQNKNRAKSSVSVLPAQAKQKSKHNPEKYWHKVTHVVDGDTVKALIDGKEQTIRIIGIDTPESTTSQECFGSEASASARRILSNKWIKIKSDKSQDDKDKYGRLLRYISYGKNIDFGERSIAKGYAYEYTYDRPYEKRDLYLQRQQEAQSKSLGLWKTDTCAGQRIKPAPTPAPIPKATVRPQPAPAPQPNPAPNQSGVYYANCTEARNAGAAPIYAGQPGYRPALDRDNDGIACE